MAGCPREAAVSVPGNSLPVMPMPGPPELGRAVVVPPGATPPGPWATAPSVTVDAELLADEAALAAAVQLLHRRWAGREPHVVELHLGDDELAAPEATSDDPWRLGDRFTFLRERLHFLVWANSYDARRDPPVWWWAYKAERLGAEPGGPADVVLADGSPAYVDGGPRGPAAAGGMSVVHAESVAAGRLAPGRSGESALAGLAPDQAAAAGHAAGAAQVIAPAGSGKTRTLIARVRHLVEDRGIEPELVCAVAYNTRAAAEMRARLGPAAGAQVRTIHSLGWEIVREARGAVTLLGEREVRARLDPLVRVPRRPNADTVGPFIEALGEVRIALRDPTAVEADRDDVPGFAEIYPRYRRLLDRRAEADFDEQVHGAVVALLADPALRRRWQERCRHLLVDEFQDLTPAYLLLLRLLAAPALDVFGVGDDDQTIYGYLGADPAYLIDYPDLFPGAARHDLEVNYRCPVEVVGAAGRLLDYNRRRLEKSVRPGPTAESGAAAFEVVRRDGRELAVAAAEQVVEWLGDGPPGETAVLARVNSALLPVQAALVDLGVPFHSPLGPDVLRRSVLAAALAWLRIAREPAAIRRADLLAAVRRPSRGLNRVATEIVPPRVGRLTPAAVAELGADLEGRQLARWHDFVADLEDVAAAAADGTAGAVLDVVVDRVGLESAARALDGGRTRVDRSAQSDDLVAVRRAAAVHPDLGDFAAWLSGVLVTPHEPAGVTLSTVHRVKGMEWDRVLVFGADRGLLPHDLAADWEEERRVFHVAITRGRRRVAVLADQARPSPFLAELTGAARRPAARQPAAPAVAQRRLPPGVTAAVGEPLRTAAGFAGRVVAVEAGGVRLAAGGSGDLLVRWGEEVSAGGRTGPLAPDGTAGLPPADPGLVRRLKEWRLATARDRGVPAYVVLHDATLEEIAARRPESESALAAVPGIGPAKLDAYGDDLLALVAG